MSKELLKSYFERDLTETEKNRLGEMLADDPENSMRFLEEARKSYLATGLPDPGAGLDLPASPSGSPAFPWAPAVKAVVGLTLLGAASLWYRQSQPVEQVLPTVPGVTAPVPQPQKQAPPPKVDRSKPAAALAPKKEAEARPGMVRPLAYDPSQKYGGLDVIVQRDVPGFVTVRVMDASQREVRLLFAGRLEAGVWNFPWEGQLEEGSLAPPGSYQVEVRSGKDLLLKEIEIRRE